MATIVIGGQSSRVGKTSVVCSLIAAMPRRHWTAVKITQCKHDEVTRAGCDCELAGHAFAISEEHDPATRTDSSRYLASGAARSFWIRSRPGRLAEAMPEIRELIASSENAILESNSILQFLRPDLYAMVLDLAMSDFKASARDYLDRADAVLLPVSAGEQADWAGVPVGWRADLPKFHISPPIYNSPEFTAFVAQTIERSEALASPLRFIANPE